MQAKRWLRKLYVQVLIGVVLGSLLGYFDPQLAVQAKPLGDLFIKAIKVVVTPVIFITIVVGIATIGDMKKVAKVGLKALIYFEIASTIALFLGMVVGNLWKVGNGINAKVSTLDAGAVASVVQKAKPMTFANFFLDLVPNTFMEPFATGEILPVLFVAVLFGIGLAKLGERTKMLVKILDQVSSGLFVMVGLIMRLAPVGAFGALAFSIGKYGIGTLKSLGELVASVYVVSILFVVIVLGISTKLAGINIFKLIAYFKDELLIVFASTSGETMIPRSMEKLDRLGVKREVVGLVMPTGFSFNMSGTAIYMTMGVLFIAHATNTHLSLAQQLSMFLIMLLTSKGAAGVSGGGFVALAATLPTLGVLPVAGLSLLIGVDRFMAEIRAVTNLFSNVVATVVVGRWAGALDMDVALAELENGPPVTDPNLFFKQVKEPDTVKVMSTLAVEVALNRSLLPSWRSKGLDASIDWNPTAVLKQKILAGERADAVILIDESMDQLVREGLIVQKSVTPIAQALFGLGVRKGAARPDISTPEAFKQTLLKARSIAYSRTGASGIYFAELIERLGIADEINARALVIPSGFTAKHVVSEECDLAVQQVSELMSIDGVDVVGPFPELYQVPTDFSIGIFSDAADPEGAQAFIAHLSSAEASAAYENGGLRSRLAGKAIGIQGTATPAAVGLRKVSA
ncbi:MAG: C4-dicarboxylate transporter DctA [Acidobacteriaceae bacterium]|nr:C4-dicarboxylate transporter DctA [Acidobacteriaceae bacterium]